MKCDKHIEKSIRQIGTGAGSFPTLCIRIFQQVFVPTFTQVRTKYLGVDRVPPIMCTSYDCIEIVGVNMHIMFASIVANIFTHFIFQLCRNSVFRSIHVRDFCMLQPLGELVPCLGLNIVGLPDVETPYVARRLL